MIRVVFLGKLADLAGQGECELAGTTGEVDWSGLLVLLQDNLNPAISAAAVDAKTKLAINGKLLPDKSALAARDGDEIALLPPVSGG